MAIDPRFIVNLKGKDFVLLAGLLDLGHKGGLIAIENEVLADLSAPEKDTWVVRSTGRFRSDHGEAIWSAHGDASPGNSQMRGGSRFLHTIHCIADHRIYVVDLQTRAVRRFSNQDIEPLHLVAGPGGHFGNLVKHVLDLWRSLIHDGSRLVHNRTSLIK